MNMLTCLRCGHRWTPRIKRRPVQCPACHSPAWDRQPNPPFPGFYEVFKTMNRLKDEGMVRDWAVYGAVAYIFHEEPIETHDIDIMVLADTDAEYAAVFRSLSRFGQAVPASMNFLIYGVQVQVFPTSIKPVYRHALLHAVNGRVGDQPVKVASREHLIVLALDPFRPGKDWGRIVQLVERADKGEVERLLRRFDQDGRLRRNLERLFPDWSD